MDLRGRTLGFKSWEGQGLESRRGVFASGAFFALGAGVVFFGFGGRLFDFGFGVRPFDFDVFDIFTGDGGGRGNNDKGKGSDDGDFDVLDLFTGGGGERGNSDQDKISNGWRAGVFNDGAGFPSDAHAFQIEGGEGILGW